jgi:hypothetical protein
MAIKEEIFAIKQEKNNGDILEINVQRVDKETHYPEGIRYSLIYIRDNKTVVRLDNYHREGHHRHIGERKLPYEFKDEWSLIGDFIEELRKQNITL